MMFRYGDISFTLANLITRVFSNLNSNFDMKKMKEFNELHKNLGTASNVFKELLETVQTNGN